MFKASALDGEFQEFDADGFEGKVCGAIYKGDATGGVPLGGLGTGYLDFNSDGTLGKCTLFNNWPKPRELNSPFLAIKFGSEIRLLTLKPPEGLIGAKAISYWGHFPAADAIYELDIPLEINLRAFSPFVLGDADASNIPGAVFQMKVKNSSLFVADVRLAFCWPGPIPSQNETFQREIFSDETDKTDKMRGVSVAHGRNVGVGYVLGVISSDSPDSPDSPDLTKTLIGEALGTSSAPWSAINDIELPQPQAQSPGATVAVDAKLNPNEIRTFNFILTWHYPRFRDSDGKPHQHRYSFRFKNAKESAAFLATNADKLLSRTLKWQNAIYKSDLPVWLKDALINGLYSLAKNTFWLKSDKVDDWWGESGLFVHSESFSGCPISETMVCRFHGHFPALFLFPELELSTLRGFKHYQLKTGEIPFSFGQPTGVDRPHYYCQHPLNSSQYVQLVYRLFCRYQDEALLKEFYPSIKDAINFAKSLDADSDGLVNDHSHAPEGETWPANQFYDIWPWPGTSTYVASTWLATLKIAEKMAMLVNDPSFAKDCQVWFNKGFESFDSKLWNGKYYRLYNDTQHGRISEVCLANQLMGQWCGQIVGINEVFPKDRIRSALDSIGALNFRATECGIVNGCLPNGKRDTSGGTHSSEIFVGESLCVAMTMIYSGRRRQGLEIAKRIYESIALKHKTPWNQYCLIGSEKGQPIWGSDYYSNMAIWALPMAIRGEDISKFSQAGGFLEAITKKE